MVDLEKGRRISVRSFEYPADQLALGVAPEALGHDVQRWEGDARRNLSQIALPLVRRNDRLRTPSDL